mmetsp:Transcript_26235/g.40028  ORF Transcript_26235/g.40028 Transcript_26235/m.40028 type:complete len:123 (+) Transcript_26235:1548-1916(+)
MLRKQMQRVIEEQSREMEEMQGDFHKATSLLNEKYQALNKRYDQLQELYENRPSRPEDMDMIKDQDEQIVQKDAFIKKQEDDMKFYKLELINREQNYNQLFGNTPIVGGVGPAMPQVVVAQQ